ncbi:MAG TPA: PKD domain-containing protein [Anaerolineae bacterium]|nr:PKD domain-containing protein [Anaerolineae bacterium]HQI86305.1 PKD domain-containing protein [Anaerolineae bacterium]
MKRSHPLLYLLLTLALLGLGLAARPLAANPASPLAPLTARGAVEAAWQRANAVGAYTYATDIEQTTWPLPKLENVGLHSTVEHIYIEGETDVAAGAMRLALWSEGGSTAIGGDSLQLRVEQDKAWGRIGAGEWEELKDGAASLNLFAPGGDPLGYLAAAQDITRLDSQTRAGVAFERYSFRLDGPAFAAHMRDLMEAELTRKGELPPGLSLDLTRTYLEMTGSGELWIDSAGLPLRMITHAKFPPDRLEQVEATITTDFTDWKTDAAPTGAAPARFIKAALAKAQDPSFGIQLSLLTAFLAFTALLITCHASQLYAAVVIVVIASMVGTPLLQSQQVYAFTQKQDAAHAEFEEQQKLNQKQAQLEADLSRKDFNPQRDPLAGNAAVPAANTPGLSVTAPMTATPSACDDLPNDTGVDTDGDGLTDLQELCLGSNPNQPDTDGDGLNDGIEVYELGLEPTAADTDGDGLPDGVEVQGIVDGTGKRWYLNALDVDTNGDEVPDGMECALNAGALVCPDTDLDGVADVFDFDDDGDGVPDKFDNAPLLAMGEIAQISGRAVITGFADQVFEFTLAELAVDTPVFVDFQLRPVNPKHLWYTLNVLDWPSNDREGQVQRVHETTFGNSGEEADGDLRLIPMLELEIPYHDGQYGYLPVIPDAPAITPSTPITAWLDTAQMDMYGITVRAKDASGEVLLAYVPVSLVQDDYQGRVAFTARMVYRPAVSAPGLLQKARLAWLLQAKTDTCTTPPDGLTEEERNAWCDGTAHWVETPSRIIHSYYDDWYLTGLSVREDHGLDVGVIFEDPDYAISQPDYDPETYYESNLWQLANGLDQSFIAGRDADADGARDLPLAEIARRFDRDLNTGVTPTETWGLPQGAFQVVTQTFAHQGYLAALPMTTTKQILADYFMEGNRAKIQAPTLLFAREERFRAAALEDLVTATQAGIRQGNRLAVTMAAANFPDIVLTGMSWSPFRYKGAGVWDAYPYDEYINRLGDSVRPWLAADSEFGSDPYVLEGALLVASSFYLTVLAGATSVVELDGAVQLRANVASDLEISYGIAGGAGAGAKVLVGLIADKLAGPKEITLFTENVRVGGHDLLKDLGKQKAGEPGMFTKLWQKLSTFQKGVFVAALVTCAVVAVGLVGLALALYFIGGTQLVMKMVNYVIKGVLLIVKVVAIITAIKGIIEIAKKIKGAFDAITKAAVVAAVIGLMVTALVSLGLFIFQMIKGGVGFASLEFNQAFADMVATVIVAAIMVAIGFIPIVGQLIVAIIGMIDLVFSTICMTLGVDEKVANNEGGGWKIMQEWFCPGLTGLLTKLVQFLTYDQTPLVDLEAKDLMQIQNFDVGAVDALKGMTAGNRLAISANVLTTLYREIPVGLGDLYLWQFADMYMDDSTFRYAFVPTNTQTLDVARWQMEEEWIPANNDHGAYWDTKRFTSTQPVRNDFPIPLAKAGLNQEPPLYLVESYAFNAQECFMMAIMVGPWVIPVPVCYLREKTDNVHIYMGNKLKLDVFPATLDGFYELADRGQRSYALAWDARFPTLADADGDNLRSAAWGGNDPDDGTPDSDVDGLSDWYELQHGLDPMAADGDGDGDGLEDYWEVFYGTAPYLSDSDGDGLTDKEELDGWEYVYAFKDEGGVEVPLITRVVSDPNDPDADGDGISDKLEQVYGFNPNVYSSSAVLGVSSVIDDGDGIVAPGATIVYTATIENYLRDRYALGLLEVEFPAAVQNSDIEPQPYTLGPSQTTTLNGQVTLRSDIDHSYAISLTNRAGANIADLRGEAAGRVLWLHLNEISGTTQFADASLTGNAGACTGVACPIAGQAGYAGLAPRFDGVEDYITADSVSTAALSQTLSLGAWVYAESGAAAREAALAFQTNADEVRAALYYNPTTQKFEYDDGATTQSSAATFAANGWHHVMVTLDSANAGVLYVDGRPEATFTSAARPETGGKFSIGQASGAWFKGFIDEVEVFPRALSAEEILLYVTTPALHVTFDGSPDSGGGVLWLPLNETAGATQFADASSAGNNGTCTVCPAAGQAGYHGLAAYFDGVDDYISLGNPASLPTNGQITLLAWIKPEATDGLRNIIAHGYSTSPNGEVFLRLSGGNYEVGSWNGTSYGASYAIPSSDLNQWIHLAGVYDGSNWILYRNGQEVARQASGTGAVPVNSNWAIGARGTGTERFFQGTIDEVEIYARALTPQEIARYSLGDSSANQIPIMCSGSQCPTAGISAPVGQGVAFNQTQWLSTGGSSSLDLSKGAGQFSLAAWIKPEVYTVFIDNFACPNSVDPYECKDDPIWRGWYGILGREAGVQGYPTLYVNPAATRIGLRFGDGATACGYQTVNSIITPNEWQHVGVTFDGELMTFYINGIAVDTSAACNGKKPYAGNWLYAGRPNANGYVWFDYVRSDNIHWSESAPELLLDWDGVNRWRKEVWKWSSSYDIHVPISINNDSAHDLWFCEKDFSTPSDRCGTSGGIDNDDTLVRDNRYNIPAGNFAPSFYQESNGAIDGQLFWAQDNDFYKGALDDLRIYPYALTAVQMDDLFTGMQRLLELRFDEAPGRDIFADDSGNGAVGVCSGVAVSGDTCPDSGLPGRANQAARFDGVNDFVDLGGGPVVVGSDPFAVSAWVKTQAAQEQVILQQRNAAGGYQLRVTADGNVGWWSSGAGLPGVVVTSTGALVNDNLWHHLVATRERDGGGRIYIDGVERGAASGTVRALTAGAVVVGADKTDNTKYFAGLIDHVLVINKAPTAAEVLALLREAPAINLRLDEPLFEAATGVTTTVFANAANPSVNAGCVLNPTAQQCGCPKAGLDGWMRGAIVFDSMNYASDAPQCLELPSASTPDSFTVGGWFKPTRQRWIGDQILIGKAGSFELTILRGSMRVKFDVTQGTRAPQAINSIVTTATLMLNQWNHVAATYGDGKLTLYLNGQPAATGDLPSRATNANPIHIGNQFVGLADEVFMTDMALDNRAISDMYRYQVAWYDAAFSHDITIDADNPTVAIDHPAAFIPLQPGYVMAATARDATSAIVSVDYRVNGGATWQAAQRDEDLWLFAITPTVEGALTLRVRAADSVGHVSQNSLTVTVDGTAPQVSLDGAPGARGAEASLHLTGVATDTLSGVSAVYVTLFDATNAPVNGAHLATLRSLSGPANTLVAWEVDYPFPFPPNGSYTVQLSAVDAVNNATVRTPLQRPSAVLMRPQAVSATQFVIEVDGTAPFADVTALAAGDYAITGAAPLPTLTGAVVEAPYPTGQVLHMHLEEPAGATRFYDASRTRLVGDCEGSACPASAAGYYGQATSFDGNDALTLAAGGRLGSLRDDLTVMAWVRLNSIVGLQHLISADSANSANGFGLGVNGQGLVFNAYGAHTFESSAVTLSAGQWTHIAAVLESSSGMTVTFYVNGVAQETLTSTLTLSANADDAFRIGANLNGLLDEVVIYDRALTSAQLQAIANPGVGGVASVEIAFQHAQDRHTPGSLAWQPVTLASPGAAFSTWTTTLPAGLEGPHQVYLRTADALGHTRVISNVWQGEIDTQAPRVTLTHYAPRFPGDRDLYRCWSEDYNLSAPGYECPVNTSQPVYQNAAWYTELFPQTKLWRYTSPATVMNAADAADALTACDIFGACTTVARATQTLNLTLGVAIFTPTHTSVFTSHAPIAIGGTAYAQANLNNLTLTANGQVIHTENWGGSATSAAWQTTFTPANDGVYNLLATIYDAAAHVITSSAPLNGAPGPLTTFYVDATAPEISITTPSVTQANFTNGYIRVAGLVNESVGITRLEIRLNDGDWQPIPHTFQPGWQPWSVDLYSGALEPPAGASYTLAARVTDVAGNTAEASRVVWADATPPTAFAATLSYYDATGARRTLMPGAVIDDVLAPTLFVEWTASGDESGLAPYQVRWMELLPGTQQAVRTVAVADPRSDSLNAGGSQKLAVEITARDLYGNETVVTVGPVYVDYQLTPVYVGPLPPAYQGWLQSSCNLIGTDTRVAERALPNASLSAPQRLYAAWNADGLRLAWTGANWNLHGDLFVYLDTQSGGSTTAYDPYSTLSDTVTLGMAADYVVWVQDGSTATLLRWNGSQWVSATGLSYAFATSVTDLFVPFSALGIANPDAASLSLVAFAVEEGALKVWAAMPSTNPVNSDLATAAGWEPGVLALTARYTWAALTDGTCPNDAAGLLAAFTAAPVAGAPPLAVTFTDHSSGGVTGWQWNFGDGATSTAQHPSHTYAAGTYTVTLTVSGANGSASVIRPLYIAAQGASAAPAADFTAAPLSGQAPLTVVFTDTSTGDIAAWQWAFGDSATSLLQHPTHQYTAPGTYTVTLTVSGAGGSNSISRANYIHVTQPTTPPEHTVFLPLVLRNTP